MKYWMTVLLLCFVSGCSQKATRSQLKVHSDGIPFLSLELRDHYVEELQEAAFSNGVVDIQKFKAFVGSHPDRDVKYYWNGISYGPATLAQLYCLCVSGDLSEDQHGELVDWANGFNQ